MMAGGGEWRQWARGPAACSRPLATALFFSTCRQQAVPGHLYQGGQSCCCCGAALLACRCRGSRHAAATTNRVPPALACPPQIINPGATLIQVLEWTLLNSTVGAPRAGAWVLWGALAAAERPPFRSRALTWALPCLPLSFSTALIGYYFAAFTIDRPWMGRMRMQAMGFAWMGEARTRAAWETTGGGGRAGCGTQCSALMPPAAPPEPCRPAVPHLRGRLHAPAEGRHQVVPIVSPLLCLLTAAAMSARNGC